MSFCVCLERNVRKMNNTPLKNNTLYQRIQDISDSAEVTVLGRIKNNKFFAIQTVESTGVAYISVLLVIVRYLKKICFVIYQNAQNVRI